MQTIYQQSCFLKKNLNSSTACKLSGFPKAKAAEAAEPTVRWRRGWLGRNCVRRSGHNFTTVIQRCEALWGPLLCSRSQAICKSTQTTRQKTRQLHSPSRSSSDRESGSGGAMFVMGKDRFETIFAEGKQGLRREAAASLTKGVHPAKKASAGTWLVWANSREGFLMKCVWWALKET